MLMTGVDRVVEQVINPKVSNVFKPEVDRAICDYLGIDYDQWQKKKEMREELLKRKAELEAEEAKQQQQQHQQQNPPPSELCSLFRICCYLWS